MRNIYKYIPYEKLILETSISNEEILKRLAENISDNEAVDWVWLRGRTSSNHYFGGTLFESGFKVSPNISYRNSFIPKVEGEIKSSTIGSTIELKLALHGFISVFGIIWLGVAFLMIVVGSLSLYKFGENLMSSRLLFPMLMFAGGYLLFYLGFKYESRKARKFLTELLEANEVQL